MQITMIKIFILSVILILASIGFYTWQKYSSKYSLTETLDEYGFSSKEQKQALEDILIKSSIISKNSSLETAFPAKNNADDLAKDIISFIKSIQNKLVIRSGIQERWEVDAPKWMEQNKKEILADLKTLGFVDEVWPKKQKVDAVCILGANAVRMLDRISYTDKLLKLALKTKAIILLTGERYVTKDKDATEDELIEIATKYKVDDWRNLAETHLFQELYNKSLIDKQLPFYVIDTPRGKLPRPTTQTTIIELIKWLKKHPEIKNIVFVSNEPYVKYQQAIIDNIIKEYSLNLEYEVVGSKNTQESLQPTLEGLGSYIWARSPQILAKILANTKDESVKKELKDLYFKYPLIYNSFPDNLF